MEKIVKQFIVDNNEDFLYLRVYNKIARYDKTVTNTVLLIQTKDSIYRIPFTQVLYPTNTINDLIKTFKSNDNIEHIIYNFYYETLLKF